MSLASKVTAFASRNACTLAAWSYASLVFSIAMGSSAPRALTVKGTASPLKRPNPREGGRENWSHGSYLVPMVTICVYAKLNILHSYPWAWTSMLYFTTSNQLNDSLVETKCKLISISYGASYYARSLASKVAAFSSRNACNFRC